MGDLYNLSGGPADCVIKKPVNAKEICSLIKEDAIKREKEQNEQEMIDIIKAVFNWGGEWKVGPTINFEGRKISDSGKPFHTKGLMKENVSVLKILKHKSELEELGYKIEISMDLYPVDFNITVKEKQKEIKRFLRKPKLITETYEDIEHIIKPLKTVTVKACCGE